jgi:ATP-dependent 26S proteasome regulatory subunit
MLLELDRFDGVTVFATNLASNYDTAFVRRILGHVELPLPDTAQRRRLFRRLIPARLPANLSEADVEQLIEESEGLSGGDLLNVVITAASAAIEREGPGCTVTPGDFRAAIDGVHRARASIGRQTIP